jgi:hypothetical protein
MTPRDVQCDGEGGQEGLGYGVWQLPWPWGSKITYPGGVSDVNSVLQGQDLDQRDDDDADVAW